MSSTAQLLAHVLQAQQVAMLATISSSSVSGAPSLPPANPPPPASSIGGMQLTGPPPDVHIVLEPGTYSLAGYSPHPSRTSNACLSGCFAPVFTVAHVPILINGFTLRLSSFGEGATLDAGSASRHFHLLQGDYSYTSDSGAGDGTSSVITTSFGGSLVLDHVHLIGGRADIRQPMDMEFGSDALSFEHASVGGGCVLVQRGSVTMTAGRLSGCTATNAFVHNMPANFAGGLPSGVPSQYTSPRGGAIDVMQGSVTLTDVQLSQIDLDDSGRSSIGGSRGGAINLRAGTSLSLTRTAFTCKSSAGSQLAYADLDAAFGGAIAGYGATISISSSVIHACRASEGGAVYVEEPPASVGSLTPGTLTVVNTTLLDNIAVCVHEPGGIIPGVCSGGGHGGCVYASGTAVSISSSSLEGCQAFEGHGGAIHALQSSTITVVSSNVTGGRATTRTGVYAGYFSEDLGRGAVASLRASTLQLQVVSLTDNRAESGAHLISFLAPTQATLGSGRRLQTASAGTSSFSASELAIAHTCASTSPNEASLVAEGSRAAATLPNYRVIGMRGLQARIGGPCDASALTTSLQQMVAGGGSAPSVCSTSGGSCNGATFTDADGRTSDVCAIGAECTCVPVAVVMPSTVDMSLLPATPQCACPAGTSTAQVSGMPSELVPFDAPSIGCETRVSIASFLYSADAVVLTLNKDASAETVDVNVSLTFGGSVKLDTITWNLTSSESLAMIANATMRPVVSLLPSWLSAPVSMGAVSKLTTDSVEVSVPLRISAVGLREGATPHRYDLAVGAEVGLRYARDWEAASIPISLFISAEPVAAQCTVPPLVRNTSIAQSLLNATTVVEEPFTFTFVSRDCDGLELSHRVVGFTMRVSRNGVAVSSTIAGYEIEYVSGGTYNVRIIPKLLGAYELHLLHDEVPFNASERVDLNVVCATGMEALGDGLCGCAAGAQPDMDTAGVCRLCPRGFYKPLAGDFACTPCFDLDVASWPGQPGARSRDECMCPVGYYRMHNTSVMPSSNAWLSSLTCQRCPQGTNCTQSGVTVETLMIVPTYWRSSSWTPTVRSCPRGASCAGGTNLSSRCACAGAGYPCPRPMNLSYCARELDVCREGHTGPYCDVCLDKYYHDGEACTWCAFDVSIMRGNLLLLVLVCATSLVLLSIMWWLFKCGKVVAVTRAETAQARVRAMRPLIEPQLKRRLGLGWRDITPILATIRTREELLSAVTNPRAFLRRLSAAGGPVARKLMMNRLRPNLQPMLDLWGITWAAAEPVFESITVSELQRALDTPSVVVRRLAAALANSHIIPALIARMKPRLERIVRPMSIVWDDLEPALRQMDSLEELLNAVQDPEAFVAELANGAKVSMRAAAHRFAIARLRPVLEPRVLQLDVSWEHIVPALEKITSIEQLRDAIVDPPAFLKTLSEGDSAASKGLVIAMLRPRVMPLVQKYHIEWTDLRAALDLVEPLDDLRQALTDATALLTALMEDSTAAAERFAVARLRRKIMPLVPELLALPPRVGDDAAAELLPRWSDIAPALVYNRIFSADDLRAALSGPADFITALAHSSKRSWPPPPVAKRLAIARLRPVLEVHIQHLGLTYERMVPVLMLLELEDLQGALAQEACTFVASVESADGRAGRQLAIARLHSALPPSVLIPLELTWEGILPMLEGEATVEELRDAIEEPEDFVCVVLPALKERAPDAPAARSKWANSTVMNKAKGFALATAAFTVAAADAQAAMPPMDSANCTQEGQATSSEEQVKTLQTPQVTGSPLLSGWQPRPARLSFLGACFHSITSVVQLENVFDTVNLLVEMLSGPTSRILISLYQVLRPIGEVFQVDFPPMYTNFLGALRVIELDFVNVQSMPLACVLTLNAHHSLVLRTAGPLVVVAALVLIAQLCHGLAASAARSGHEMRAERMRTYAGTSENSIFVLFFLIYPSTCARIFEAFIPHVLENGQRYLASDFSIHYDSPAHRLMQLYAIGMLVVYPLGTPLLYALVMLRHKKTLRHLQRAELLAAGEKHSASMSLKLAGLGPTVRADTLKLAILSIGKKKLGIAPYPHVKQSKGVAREVHVVLHSHSLAWHTNSHMPIPKGTMRLVAHSECELDIDDDGLYGTLRVTGCRDMHAGHDTTPDIGVALQVAAQSDDTLDVPPPPLVVLSTWQNALREQIPSASETPQEDNEVVVGGSIAGTAHTDTSDELKKRAQAALPPYFKKLVGPYELRVFYFEIFECVRKIFLIGLPVFFLRGTIEQCVLGLLVCFLSFGAYMALSPFTEKRHDIISQLCQLQIFLIFLVSVLLKGAATNEPRSFPYLDRILVAASIVPPAVCAILGWPRLSRYILEEEHRAKALSAIGRAAAWVCRCGVSSAPARIQPPASSTRAQPASHAELVEAAATADARAAAARRRCETLMATGGQPAAVAAARARAAAAEREAADFAAEARQAAQAATEAEQLAAMAEEHAAQAHEQRESAMQIGADDNEWGAELEAATAAAEAAEVAATEQAENAAAVAESTAAAAGAAEAAAANASVKADAERARLEALVADGADRAAIDAAAAVAEVAAAKAEEAAIAASDKREEADDAAEEAESARDHIQAARKHIAEAREVAHVAQAAQAARAKRAAATAEVETAWKAEMAAATTAAEATEREAAEQAEKAVAVARAAEESARASEKEAAAAAAAAADARRAVAGLVASGASGDQISVAKANAKAAEAEAAVRAAAAEEAAEEAEEAAEEAQGVLAQVEEARDVAQAVQARVARGREATDTAWQAEMAAATAAAEATEREAAAHAEQAAALAATRSAEATAADKAAAEAAAAAEALRVRAESLVAAGASPAAIEKASARADAAESAAAAKASEALVTLDAAAAAEEQAEATAAEARAAAHAASQAAAKSHAASQEAAQMAFRSEMAAAEEAAHAAEQEAAAQEQEAAAHAQRASAAAAARSADAKAAEDSAKQAATAAEALRQQAEVLVSSGAPAEAVQAAAARAHKAEADAVARAVAAEEAKEDADEAAEEAAEAMQEVEAATVAKVQATAQVAELATAGAGSGALPPGIWPPPARSAPVVDAPEVIAAAAAQERAQAQSQQAVAAVQEAVAAAKASKAAAALAKERSAVARQNVDALVVAGADQAEVDAAQATAAAQSERARAATIVAAQADEAAADAQLVAQEARAEVIQAARASKVARLSAGPASRAALANAQATTQARQTPRPGLAGPSASSSSGADAPTLIVAAAAKKRAEARLQQAAVTVQVTEGAAKTSRAAAAHAKKKASAARLNVDALVDAGADQAEVDAAQATAAAAATRAKAASVAAARADEAAAEAQLAAQQAQSEAAEATRASKLARVSALPTSSSGAAGGIAEPLFGDAAARASEALAVAEATRANSATEATRASALATHAAAAKVAATAEAAKAAAKAEAARRRLDTLVSSGAPPAAVEAAKAKAETAEAKASTAAVDATHAADAAARAHDDAKEAEETAQVALAAATVAQVASQAALLEARASGDGAGAMALTAVAEQQARVHARQASEAAETTRASAQAAQAAADKAAAKAQAARKRMETLEASGVAAEQVAAAKAKADDAAAKAQAASEAASTAAATAATAEEEADEAQIEVEEAEEAVSVVRAQLAVPATLGDSPADSGPAEATATEAAAAAVTAVAEKKAARATKAKEAVEVIASEARASEAAALRASAEAAKARRAAESLAASRAAPAAIKAAAAKADEAAALATKAAAEAKQQADGVVKAKQKAEVAEAAANQAREVVRVVQAQVAPRSAAGESAAASRVAEREAVSQSRKASVAVRATRDAARAAEATSAAAQAKAAAARRTADSLRASGASSSAVKAAAAKAAAETAKAAAASTQASQATGALANAEATRAAAEARVARVRRAATAPSATSMTTRARATVGAGVAARQAVSSAAMRAETRAIARSQKALIASESSQAAAKAAEATAAKAAAKAEAAQKRVDTLVSSGASGVVVEAAKVKAESAAAHAEVASVDAEMAADVAAEAEEEAQAAEVEAEEARAAVEEVEAADANAEDEETMALDGATEDTPASSLSRAVVAAAQVTQKTAFARAMRAAVAAQTMAAAAKTTEAAAAAATDQAAEARRAADALAASGAAAAAVELAKVRADAAEAQAEAVAVEAADAAAAAAVAEDEAVEAEAAAEAVEEAAAAAEEDRPLGPVSSASPLATTEAHDAARRRLSTSVEAAESSQAAAKAAEATAAKAAAKAEAAQKRVDTLVSSGASGASVNAARGMVHEAVAKADEAAVMADEAADTAAEAHEEVKEARAVVASVIAAAPAGSSASDASQRRAAARIQRARVAAKNIAAAAAAAGAEAAEASEEADAARDQVQALVSSRAAPTSIQAASAKAEAARARAEVAATEAAEAAEALEDAEEDVAVAEGAAASVAAAARASCASRPTAPPSAPAAAARRRAAALTRKASVAAEAATVIEGASIKAERRAVAARRKSDALGASGAKPAAVEAANSSAEAAEAKAKAAAVAASNAATAAAAAAREAREATAASAAGVGGGTPVAPRAAPSRETAVAMAAEKKSVAHARKASVMAESTRSAAEAAKMASAAAASNAAAARRMADGLIASGAPAAAVQAARKRRQAEEGKAAAAAAEARAATQAAADAAAKAHAAQALATKAAEDVRAVTAHFDTRRRRGASSDAHVDGSIGGGGSSSSSSNGGDDGDDRSRGPRGRFSIRVAHVAEELEGQRPVRARGAASGVDGTAPLQTCSSGNITARRAMPNAIVLTPDDAVGDVARRDEVQMQGGGRFFDRWGKPPPRPVPGRDPIALLRESLCSRDSLWT